MNTKVEVGVRTEEGKKHLVWCKERALQYVESGDLTLAWNSMLSDLSKNEELKNHPAIELGNMLFSSDKLNTQQAMKKFIEDFN